MDSNTFPKKIFKNLPPILKEVVGPYEDRSRDVVLLSSLTVLSAVLPKISAMYDSDVVFPHFYTMIVAPAASGKSVMMKATRLIEPVHQYVKIKNTALDFNIFQSDEEIMLSSKNSDKNSDKKSKDDKLPDPVITIVPANCSSAEFMRFISLNSNGIIMIESEMDTMGNVFKSEWGDYSDLLRKSFHNEKLSLSRKSEGLHLEVSEPKLSLLLSGTPAQVTGITRSKENGLFSRFIIYKYDEITAFRNVFIKHKTPINELFDGQGQEVLKIFKKLDAFKENIIFELTEKQENLFMKFHKKYQADIIEDESIEFISNLRRLALLLFRMCMILTVCRKSDIISEGKKLVCEDQDFMIAMRIMKVLNNHSLLHFKGIEENGNMSDLDLKLLDLIESEKEFERSKFIELGLKLGMSARTLDNKLKEWKQRGIIYKKKHGIYHTKSIK